MGADVQSGDPGQCPQDLRGGPGWEREAVGSLGRDAERGQCHRMSCPPESVLPSIPCDPPPTPHPIGAPRGLDPVRKLWLRQLLLGIAITVSPGALI